MSTRSTRLPNSALKISATATVVVVLATPPLRLIVAITLANGDLLFLSQRRTSSRRNTGPDRRIAIGGGKSPNRARQFATAWLVTPAISAISNTPTRSCDSTRQGYVSAVHY